MCNYSCFLSSFCFNPHKKKLLFFFGCNFFLSFFFELYVFVFVCVWFCWFQCLSSDVFVINRIANEVTLSCSSFRLIFFSHLFFFFFLSSSFFAYELILFHYVNMKAMRVTTLRNSVCAWMSHRLDRCGHGGVNLIIESPKSNYDLQTH